MALPTLFRWIVERLEHDGIAYGIGGSIATMHYGKFRATNDIDIVMAPTSLQLIALVRAANAADFYASDIAADEAIRSSGSFNIIDPDTAFKADLFVVTNDAAASRPLQRTVVSTLYDEVPARFCSVEDTILKKLEYYAEGGSSKHIDDIAQIIALKHTSVDSRFVAQEASRRGLLREWNEVSAAAKMLLRE